jgi:hypothetical protein
MGVSTVAVCKSCELEMSYSTTKSCRVAPVVFPDRTELAQIYFYPDSRKARCHDCNIAYGGVHHPGCDAEECPRCHGQLISCGCLNDPDAEEGI